MKKTEKQKVNKKPKTTESQFGVILEDINSKLNLLVEGHQSLDSKVESLDSKVESLDSKVESLDSKVESLDDKMDNLENKFDKFEDETRNNFKTVFGYLMKIDEEVVDIKSEISELKKSLSNKADLERIVNLETRVQKLELLLAQKR